MILLCLFTLILNYKICQCSATDKQLVHVHIIYRHGDRAPIIIYPTDKNREDKWPNGLGGLTNRGIMQHFKLGMWLRRRYNDFLGQYLNYSLIYVRSTDRDRALMSAESNLAGLFYNLSTEVINGLRWHPFPIQTQSRKSDILLSGDGCPLYRTKRLKLYNTNYFRSKFQPYQATLELLRKKTGFNKLDFMDSWSVEDTINCEKSNNLTVDDWVTEEVWKNLKSINQLNWELMNYGELPKLIAGYLMKKITDYLSSFSGKTWYKNKGLKMVIYSGHDTDVAPMSSLLGINDNNQPPYTSCIMIELYKLTNSSEKLAVQVIYKNFTDSSGPTEIPIGIIPGCGSTLCPLTKFLQLMEKKTISKEEYNDLCYPKYNILLTVQIVFIVLTIGLILFIIVFSMIRFNRKPEHRYTRIENENINSS